jgi:hypothetical protein
MEVKFGLYQGDLWTYTSMQNSFDLRSYRSPAIQAVIEQLASSSLQRQGAVFTKREVVECMLDLVNYSPKDDLTLTTLLEPSFGAGDFLMVALDRLLSSYFSHGGTFQEIVPTLAPCLKAVELHRQTFLLTKKQIFHFLLQKGVSREDAHSLVDTWLIQDDFLLADLAGEFTHIVGNPPYIRQELIPDLLLQKYRQIYKTIYDRADLYIPFIERCLFLLAPQGKLAFICPDRWIKNKYGGPLRQIIDERFHLQSYINMVGIDAFASDVATYPAIMVLTPQKSAVTQVVQQPGSDLKGLGTLARAMRSDGDIKDKRVSILRNVVEGAKPWILDTSSLGLALLRRLEEQFPLLETVGCQVGIGVATGCDSVFIGQSGMLPVEEDRKLPLLMAPDIQGGEIVWSGKVIINPFALNGELVSLSTYPRLAAYLRSHEAQIRKRHVAQKNPRNWYRTIDRIEEVLTRQPKLLIPDIKDNPQVVYDAGHYYPHHNLYYIISVDWDLRALQTVLRSLVTKLFISAYSVKMRGGYLRFQAQYLRRIRLPVWNSVPSELRERLRVVALVDQEACDEAVFDLYGLDIRERQQLL